MLVRILPYTEQVGNASLRASPIRRSAFPGGRVHQHARLGLGDLPDQQGRPAGREERRRTIGRLLLEQWKESVYGEQSRSVGPRARGDRGSSLGAYGVSSADDTLARDQDAKEQDQGCPYQEADKSVYQ